MDLLIGFILGVVASIVASFVFLWMTAAVPKIRQRPIVALIRNPSLFWKLRASTPERDVKERICALFRAWVKRDRDAYLICWAEGATRVYGLRAEKRQSKADIAAHFDGAIAKYSEIRVIGPVFEDIRILAGGARAVAEIAYRFALTQAQDSIPVHEESREAYALEKVDGTWFINSNIDHYSELGTGA